MTQADANVELVASAICKSGKFETGQGTCAAICMEALGCARKACSHTLRVHGDLARNILAALNTRVEPIRHPLPSEDATCVPKFDFDEERAGLAAAAAGRANHRAYYVKTAHGYQPRRIMWEHLTPLEQQVRRAMLDVEQQGAHRLLTDAVILIEHAGCALADWVDLGEPGVAMQRSTPTAPVRSAEQLTTIIREWLDADDATHWGAFEKALDAAISESSCPTAPVQGDDAELKWLRGFVVLMRCQQPKVADRLERIASRLSGDNNAALVEVRLRTFVLKLAKFDFPQAGEGSDGKRFAKALREIRRDARNLLDTLGDAK